MDGNVFVDFDWWGSSRASMPANLLGYLPSASFGCCIEAGPLELIYRNPPEFSLAGQCGKVCYGSADVQGRYISGGADGNCRRETGANADGLRWSTVAWIHLFFIAIPVSYFKWKRWNKTKSGLVGFLFCASSVQDESWDRPAVTTDHENAGTRLASCCCACCGCVLLAWVISVVLRIYGGCTSACL